MLEQAYAKAVATLRFDAHFALPVPTVYEVAAQYRKLVPDARLAEIRDGLARARLVTADG